MSHWREHAACRGYPTEMFFPERGDNAAILEAKALCARCPVRDDCLEFAVVSGERQGVWGGKTDRSLRPLRVALERSNKSRGARRQQEARRLAGLGFAPWQIADRIGVTERSLYRYLTEKTQAS